jgi:glucosylceramidase
VHQNFSLRRYFFAVCLTVLKAAAQDSNNNGNNNGSDTSKKGSPVSYFVTEGNEAALLQKHTDLYFGTKNNSNAFIDVDSTQTFQTIDGFGFTLTGGSAYVINKMNATDKAALLQQLFAMNNDASAGINYLRISIGLQILIHLSFLMTICLRDKQMKHLRILVYRQMKLILFLY